MKVLRVVVMSVFFLGLVAACGGGEGEDCTPACDGKQCGDDGCGGTCGGCAVGETCTGGQCTGGGDPCPAACADFQCGTIEAGGQQCPCGECTGEQTCNASGMCIDAACGAACEGKQCGDGGSPGCDCGTCGQGTLCTDGACTVDPCVATCEGKECGDGGVAGCDCGACDPGKGCTDGVCTDCTADCAGKECGDDGCNGSCGDCGEGTECVAGACETAGGYGPATFFNQFSVAGEDCCFDLNDDGQVDNALAGLIPMLAGFMPEGTDVQSEIDKAIAEGEMAVLVEFEGVTDWANQASFTMNLFVGKDADDDYSDNLDPDVVGDFLIDPNSLDPQTGESLIAYEGATITNGLLEGGPSTFVLDLPLSDDLNIHGQMDGATLEAQVVVNQGTDPPEIVLTDGKLGGYLNEEMIFDGLNEYLAVACECLGLSGGLIVDGQCATDGSPENCDTEIEEEKDCPVAYNACSAILAILPMTLDIDSDDDGVNDSISIGTTFSSIPARIIGVEGN